MAQEESRPITLDGNSILNTLLRPRILLLLLAAWDILAVATEFFTSSGIFMDLHGGEIDGILGARSLSWQGIPLAALYIYAARSPQRFPRVFLLALIEQASVIAAALYHLGAGDFSAESIVLPVAISGGLLFLAVLALFGRREEIRIEMRS